LGESFEGHHTEVEIAPGAHCNGFCVPLFVTDNEDIGRLLQRMLSYFIRNFLVAQVECNPKP
jgi:hypothetical protein